MKTSARIVLLGVHVLLITATVVVMAIRAYPREGGYAYLRRLNLQAIHDGIMLYRQETGEFPESLDSYLRYDKKPAKVSAALQECGIIDDNIEITRVLRYQLLDNQPVLYDLGRDVKEGGLGWDMDVAYPKEYQKPFPFREFAKTEFFLKSLIIGIILGSGTSICFYYGMWGKRYAAKPTSLPSTIIVSVVFLFFELFLAQVILLGHIYPHH